MSGNARIHCDTRIHGTGRVDGMHRGDRIHWFDGIDRIHRVDRVGMAEAGTARVHDDAIGPRIVAELTVGEPNGLHAGEPDTGDVGDLGGGARPRGVVRGEIEPFRCGSG